MAIDFLEKKNEKKKMNKKFINFFFLNSDFEINLHWFTPKRCFSRSHLHVANFRIYSNYKITIIKKIISNKSNSLSKVLWTTTQKYYAISKAIS